MDKNIIRFIRNKSLDEENDEEALKDYISAEAARQSVMWSRLVQELLKDKGYSETRLANECMLDSDTILMWTQGELPIGRTPLLKIGMSSGFDVKKLNRYLLRCGSSFPLAESSCEDLICRFFIDIENGAGIYSDYLHLKRIIEHSISMKVSYTSYCDGKLADFMCRNQSLFETKVDILYNFFENNIYLNSSEESRCLHVKMLPCRDEVIIYGINMRKSVSELDATLISLGMEPLYMLNPFEAALVFAMSCIERYGLQEEESGVAEIANIMSEMGFNGHRITEFLEME